MKKNIPIFFKVILSFLFASCENGLVNEKEPETISAFQALDKLYTAHPNSDYERISNLAKTNRKNFEKSGVIPYYISFFKSLQDDSYESCHVKISLIVVNQKTNHDFFKENVNLRIGSNLYAIEKITNITTDEDRNIVGGSISFYEIEYEIPINNLKESGLISILIKFAKPDNEKLVKVDASEVFENFLKARAALKVEGESSIDAYYPITSVMVSF